MTMLNHLHIFFINLFFFFGTGGGVGRWEGGGGVCVVYLLCFLLLLLRPVGRSFGCVICFDISFRKFVLYFIHVRMIKMFNLYIWLHTNRC